MKRRDFIAALAAAPAVRAEVSDEERQAPAAPNPLTITLLGISGSRVSEDRAAPRAMSARAMVVRSGPLAIAAWLAVGLAAQPPADFSGRWSVETAPPEGGGRGTAARGDPGSGWGNTIAITQDAAQLVVEPAIYTRYDLQPQPRFVHALDGGETRNTVNVGRGPQTQTSRARWDGASLVIVTVHLFRDPATGRPFTFDVTQRLTLESPSTLVVEAVRSGALGGAPSTTRTVYVKR